MTGLSGTRKMQHRYVPDNPRQLRRPAQQPGRHRSLERQLPNAQTAPPARERVLVEPKPGAVLRHPAQAARPRLRPPPRRHPPAAGARKELSAREPDPLRGKKFTASSARFQERLTLEEQVDRNVANLAAFLAKITA